MIASLYSLLSPQCLFPILVPQLFFLIPMFSRVRNAMKLSFVFCDHSNYFKMAVEIGVFRNLRRVLLFQCFCNNLNPVHRIQTKFGMDILLDPRNKPAETFFSKSKMDAGGQKSKIGQILPHKSHFLQ